MLWLALAIVIGGVVTGLLAGLFGIGGGAVIVPVLYEVFRILGVPEAVRMQLCVGTSLAIILPTTIRSYLTHRAKGLVVPRVIRLWALPAVIGVSCGAAIAAFAPPAVFKIAFVLIALFIATKFLFAGDRWNLGTDLPGTVPMTALRFRHRACRFADGDQRRLVVQHRADALRQDDSSGGRDIGRARRADHHCRHASAISWPAGTIARCCRRCRSASSR